MHSTPVLCYAAPMQAQRYLKELAQAHYLYRRAVVGSATQDAQRTRIAIYQRMYHAETGDWPPMGLINATILKYEPDFWRAHKRQQAAATYWASHPITNSGPGGPHCRAKSVETCRCKGRTIALTPEISAKLSAAGFTQEEIQRLGNKLPACEALTPGRERKEATSALFSLVNKELSNPYAKISAQITGESTGKIISGNALGESYRNLVDSELCDKDTAFRAHMAAAARIDDLFVNAPKHEWQELYHEQGNRIDAIHLYSPFKVDGISTPLTADISVITFAGMQGRTLYSIGLRVKPPLPDRGIRQQS